MVGYLVASGYVRFAYATAFGAWGLLLYLHGALGPLVFALCSMLAVSVAVNDFIDIMANRLASTDQTTYPPLPNPLALLGGRLRIPGVG